ncbi:MAG: ribosome maturation factor RimM [Proteobacteria bacterium]|nr:ribosome maturation factor RimM [Pseudomonadota bacterium]
MDPSDRVALGRIAGAHGVRGQLRVRILGDGPDNLLAAEKVWLRAEDETTAAPVYAVVASGSGRAGEVRLTLEGVDDRDAAESLRGRLVEVPTANLPALGDDQFYWHELLGCQVEDTSGRELGIVEDLWDTGAHDLLVVRRADGGRHLIPTAREILRHVDVAERRLCVDVPPGLLDEDG